MNLEKSLFSGIYLKAIRVWWNLGQDGFESLPLTVGKPLSLSELWLSSCIKYVDT